MSSVLLSASRENLYDVSYMKRPQVEDCGYGMLVHGELVSPISDLPALTL
jgi:hypothetical protein